MNKGFLFRRLGFLFSCFLRLNDRSFIRLSNKHNISSFQDVYLNPFYWDALLCLNFIPKNVFDLGANYGLFTSLCQQVFFYKNAKAKIDFTLIEANNNLIEKLEKLISYQNNRNKTTILYGAAGPKKSVFFNKNKKNLLASKIGVIGIEVPSINFDILDKPDLLKIDIEGAEVLLFDNYFNWLKSARAIIIEFHYEGEKLLKNFNQLKDEGFELIIDKIEGSGYRTQLWTKKEF